VEDFEAVMRSRMNSLNDMRSGKMLHWWRLKSPEIHQQGFFRTSGTTAPDGSPGSDFFVSGRAFERRESVDSPREIITFSEVESYTLLREEIATVISRVHAIENDADVLDIVREYGPLHLYGEWKEGGVKKWTGDLVKRGVDSWIWRCDTPQEWRELSEIVGEVFGLLRAIEKRSPDTDAAKSRLIDILSEHVNNASVRTYYSVLPTGDIASTPGVAFNLYAAIWKVLESTVVTSRATDYLRLRQCHYCDEWDFEKGGEGGRRIRQRSDKSFWYHDGCQRNEDKRIKDEARAELEGRERESRPGARRKSPLDWAQKRRPSKIRESVNVNTCS